MGSRTARRTISSAIAERSAALQQQCDPLAAADAQRDQAELEVPALHLVEDLGGDRRSGGADRMPERDRAAVGVDPLLVEAEIVDHRERLGGERLVELDHL